MTLKELAQEALYIQDACNLCGLAQRFAEVMIELNRHPDSTGTDWVNQHCITRLWIDKFVSLSRLGTMNYVDNSFDCWRKVSDLAKGIVNEHNS